MKPEYCTRCGKPTKADKVVLGYCQNCLPVVKNVLRSKGWRVNTR